MQFVLLRARLEPDGRDRAARTDARSDQSEQTKRGSARDLMLISIGSLSCDNNSNNNNRSMRSSFLELALISIAPCSDARQAAKVKAKVSAKNAPQIELGER